jgi:hypothetical protein
MKKLIVLLSFLVSISMVLCDTYTIGSGASFANTNWPLLTTYNYGWTKLIYTKANINAAGLNAPATFTGLAFNIGNVISNEIRSDQRIYLRHTASTSYATDAAYPDTTLFTKVFEGDLNIYGNGWVYILFDTTFTWTNISSLEILWENHSNTRYVSGPQFKYTSTSTSYQTVYSGSYTSFPTGSGTKTYNRPNIRLLTAYSTVPAPAAAAYPANGSLVFPQSYLLWSSMPCTYDVYFGESSSPPLVSENQTGNLYSLPLLTENTTYYWKVVPKNEAGPAAGCPVWSFTVHDTVGFAESFEGSYYPPLGWKTSSTIIQRSTGAPLQGSYSGNISLYSTSGNVMLSTPLLTLESDSSLEFYLMNYSSFSDLRLQMKYSTDRVNWNSHGTALSFSSWLPYTRYQVDLSSLYPAYSNVYLGFEFWTVSGYSNVYLDHIIGPAITPLPPAPVALDWPDDALTDQSAFPQLWWDDPVDAGVPDGYKVYLDTSPNPATLVADTPLRSHVVSAGLAYSTTYYWKVVPYNALGEPTGNQVFSFTTLPKVTAYPMMQTFGTTTSDRFPPYYWEMRSGMIGTELTYNTYWGLDDWLNVSNANMAAKTNIMNNGWYGWMITPPLELLTANYQLSFDLALMTRDGTASITPGSMPDERLLVVMSDSPHMTGPTVLMEWNNTGSANVFDNIPNTGTHVQIPLTGATGVKYIAFYIESVVYDINYDLMVDNVLVMETPTAPVLYYAPASLDLGYGVLTLPTAWKNINIQNLGIGSLDLDSLNFSLIGTDAALFEYDASVLPVSLTALQSFNLPVRFTPDSEGLKQATLQISYGARTLYEIQLSGTGYPDGYVAIGDGTATQLIPIYPYYAYSYSQSLFLASELPFNNYSLEKISYYWNGAQNATNSNLWTIYAGHTEKTAFASTIDWIPSTALTQVFSGEVDLPATAGWIEITLDTPFQYLNVFNLVIAVDENEAGTNSSSAKFLGTNTPEIRSLLRNQTSDIAPGSPGIGNLISAIPNIRLEFTPGAPVPIVGISPLSLSFDPLLEGDVSAWVNVTVTNMGGGSLDLAAGDFSLIGTDAMDFELDTSSLPVSLLSSQSLTVPVRFCPVSEGVKSATLRLVHDLVNYDVSLSGTGLPFNPPELLLEVDLGTLELNWAAVDGANSYKIYASTDPAAPDPWAMVAWITTPSYTPPTTETAYFIKIVASTEFPPRGER